jgi:Prion-inhibition and propagation
MRRNSRWTEVLTKEEIHRISPISFRQPHPPRGKVGCVERMAEVVGFVIGGVSVLALFGTVQDGYRFIISVKNDFKNESNYLITKLRIEHDRLHMWGRCMGISDSEKGRCFYQQPKPTQSLCVAILAEISAIVSDAEGLRKHYGLETKEVADTETLDFDGDILASVAIARFLGDFRDKIRRKTTTGKRVRWAIKDQLKFDKLLDKFHYLNDSLWNCHSPFITAFLKRSLPTFVLPAIDNVPVLRHLQSISKDSDLKYLATSAELSQLNLESAASENKAVSDETVELPEAHFSDFKDVDTVTKDRSLAVYAGGKSEKRPVLIEWRYFQNVSVNDRTLVTNRLRTLGTLLMTQKLPEFRILSCSGLLKQDPIKIGFVFELPLDEVDSEVNPVTLYRMLKISSEGKLVTPALGDRFELARTLASALALFHASKWLHKGLCSQNILFFRPDDFENEELPPLDNAYIGGFDYARPDRPGEVSGPSSLWIDVERNVYRHPDVQNLPIQPSSFVTPDNGIAQVDVQSETRHTRFQQIHDIYSLGVILYEIGMWHLSSGEYLKSMRPKDFRAKLIANCSKLAPIMGTKYEQVVRSCLKGEFGQSDVSARSLQRAFWSNVIVELNECHA